MRHSHRDPVDHFRTTHQHAGEFFIDGYHWPGLLSIAVGLASIVGFVSAIAYQEHGWTFAMAVIAILATVFGASWMALERRRVRRIEARWLLEHPDRRADNHPFDS